MKKLFKEMDENQIVYLSKYGEKYHKDKNCIHIFEKKVTQITLKEAKLKRKMPCKGCTSQSNSEFYKNWYFNKNKQIKQTNFNYKKKDIKEFNHLIKSYKLDDIIIDSFQNNIDNPKKINQKRINNENKDNFSKIEEKKESSDDIDFNCKKYSTRNELNNSNDSYLNSKSNSKNTEINQNVLNNNNNINSDIIYDNISSENRNKIKEKIQLFTKKDKTYSFNEYNKNYKKSNKLDNIIKNNQLNNNSSINNPFFLDNIQLLFNYFTIMQSHNEKNKTYTKKNNIECMEETNKNAQILFFQDSKILNGVINENDFKKKKKILLTFQKKDVTNLK